jgi:hypothetical protein
VSDPELEKAVSEFVGAFETVFRYDWPYTKDRIGDEAEGTNFIEPGLEDEEEDWGCRAELLEKYRALVSVMKTRKMEPLFPIPLERIPGFKERVW